MVDYVRQPGGSVTMPIERMTYREIADDLAARMESGEYPADARLPSVAKIAETYGVGRSTAASAVRLLHDRGLVYGIQGVGVFVSARDGA